MWEAVGQVGEGEGQRNRTLRTQRVVAKDVQSLIGDYPREVHLLQKHFYFKDSLVTLDDNTDLCSEFSVGSSGYDFFQ